MSERLYENILGITQDYLGPAAQRFIDRQIAFHLHKNPQEITKADLPDLVEWVKVSLASLTEDTKVVEKCSDRISDLATNVN